MHCVSTNPCGSDPSCVFSTVFLDQDQTPDEPIVFQQRNQDQVIMRFRINNGALAAQLDQIQLSLLSPDGVLPNPEDLVFSLHWDRNGDGQIDSGQAAVASQVTFYSDAKIQFSNLHHSMTPGQRSRVLLSLKVLSHEQRAALGWFVWSLLAMATLLYLVRFFSAGTKPKSLLIGLGILLVSAALLSNACVRSGFVLKRNYQVAITENSDIGLTPQEGQALAVQGAPLRSAPLSFDGP